MRQENVAGLCLFYEPEEQSSAELIARACEKSVVLIRDRWGLTTPRDCRVYVMTSWPGFFFHSAPWAWKLLLGATFPFYFMRFHLVWPYAGGWFTSYGRRRVVGVKPAHMMEHAHLHVGEQFYLRNRTLEEKAETVTCHELVHAFTTHLNLPEWLREGLATLAMDYYLGRPIVREETLEELAEDAPVYNPLKSARPGIEDSRALLYRYICGYWQTRYIEETRPELMRGVLSRRRDMKEVDAMITGSYEKEPGRFWDGINRRIRVRFGGGLRAGQSGGPDKFPE